MSSYKPLLEIPSVLGHLLMIHDICLTHDLPGHWFNHLLYAYIVKLQGGRKGFQWVARHEVWPGSSLVLVLAMSHGLFVVTLMQIYNGEVQAEQRQRQMCHSRRKRAPGYVTLEPSPVFMGIKKNKEMPDIVWNKRNSNLWARHYPAKLSNCEQELKESLNSERNHQQRKRMQM